MRTPEVTPFTSKSCNGPGGIWFVIKACRELTPVPIQSIGICASVKMA